MTDPSFKVASSVVGSYIPSARGVSTSPSVITIRSLFAPSRTRNGIGCGHGFVVTGPPGLALEPGGLETTPVSARVMTQSKPMTEIRQITNLMILLPAGVCRKALDDCSLLI